MTEFGQAYASAYDALYADKDYDREVDLIEQSIRRFGQKDKSTLLDLGCGTGNHAIPLALRGYSVTGVDRSEPMVSRARAKARELQTAATVDFVTGDLRDLDLGRRYDAVLMMFAVLGYQLTNSDVLATLGAAHRHLDPGGLLLFDVWYGPAVLHEGPTDRTKTADSPTGRIERRATATLDTFAHLCTVTYELKMSGGAEAGTSRESHRMRYFFPQELFLFLDIAGFEVVRIGDFEDVERDVDDTTWNVMVAARAR